MVIDRYVIIKVLLFQHYVFPYIKKLFEFDIHRVNRAIFSGSSNVDLYASGNGIASVKMPVISSKENEDKKSKLTVGESLNQQLPDLVTLSLLPRSQWKSLLNLDIIKVENIAS